MISKGHSKTKSTIRKLQVLQNTLTFHKDFGEILWEEGGKKILAFNMQQIT